MSVPSTAVEAVLFDLFGTIVPPYRRGMHHAALGRIASVLGASFDTVLEGWTSTWDARARGRFPSIVDNLRVIVPDVSDDALAEAHRVYQRFTVQSLVPKPGALEALDWMHEQGIAAALVTNCAPDVPELWAETRWSHRFRATVFSCALGVKKPDPAIYRAALDQLGVAPSAAAFVGDGSDHELQGAAAVGLSPVLVRNELDDTDDPDRDDVAGATAEGWPVVDHLEQLPSVIEQLTRARRAHG